MLFRAQKPAHICNNWLTSESTNIYGTSPSAGQNQPEINYLRQPLSVSGLVLPSVSSDLVPGEAELVFEVGEHLVTGHCSGRKLGEVVGAIRRIRPTPTEREARKGAPRDRYIS